MTRFEVAVVTTLALVFGTSCNSGEFTGSGAKKGVAASQDAKDRNDDTDKNDNTKLGHHDKAPEDKSDDAKPNTSTNTNNTSTNTNPKNDTTSDILNALLDTNNEVTITQPNDDELIYGGGKVFHIGDGNMTATSCMAGILLYGLAGKRYYFEFEVKEGGTSVTIDVNKICGVDYSDTNFISIVTAGQPVATQAIALNATTAQVSAANLAAGKYAVTVESRSGSHDQGANPADFDDYVVGEVHIKGSKPLRPGAVGTQ